MLYHISENEMKHLNGVERLSSIAGQSLHDYLMQMNWQKQQYHNDDADISDYLHDYRLRHQETLFFANDHTPYIELGLNVKRRIANIFGFFMDYLVRICYFNDPSVIATFDDHIWHIKYRRIGEPEEYVKILQLVENEFKGKRVSIEDVSYEMRNYLLQLTAFDQRYRNQWNDQLDFDLLREFDAKLILDQQVWDDLTTLYNREVSFFETYSHPTALIGNDVNVMNKYISGEIDFYDQESATLIDLKSYGPDIFNGKKQTAVVPTDSNRLQQLIYWRLADVPVNRLMLYNPLEDAAYYYVFNQPELHLGNAVDQILNEFYQDKSAKLKKTFH